MGLQISCGVHSQVPQEDALWRTEAASRGGVSSTGDAEGKKSRGGPLDAGSCSHDDIDPAEIRGFAGDRVHQGEERHPPGTRLRERKRNFIGQHFWARGHFVSTVGRDETVIRDYIRKQEAEDSRLDQLNMWR